MTDASIIKSIPVALSKFLVAFWTRYLLAKFFYFNLIFKVFVPIILKFISSEVYDLNIGEWMFTPVVQYFVKYKGVP